MSDLDPPSDELPPDDELRKDAAGARALLERRAAFELSPEQLARGKLALDAALDEHDLRSAQAAAARGGRKGERGRLRKWLYTPVLPVLAGICALALAVRFTGDKAEPQRSEALVQRSLPAPTRELVLAQAARLEARLARLEARGSTPDAPAPARSDAKEAARAPLDLAQTERDFDRAMQAYRSELLASLSEAP